MRPRVSSCVLDASALLAVIGGETGWKSVVEHLPNALICSVNLSEVAAKLSEREGLTIDDIHLRLSQYELRVIPFDERLAYAAAALRPTTRQAGLSFGDRACLATAAACNFPALTADRKWATLPINIEVRLIR